MANSPGCSLTVMVCEKPGAMFSRSSTTITPSRISHSSARFDLLTMVKVVRPAGTVISLGSQALPWIVTVTALSAVLGGALRASLEAYQKAARPATTSRAEPATAARIRFEVEGLLSGEEEDIAGFSGQRPRVAPARGPNAKRRTGPRPGRPGRR